jgi:hypothetical protein
MIDAPAPTTARTAEETALEAKRLFRDQVERDYECYRQLVCLPLQAAAAAWAAEHPREAWETSDST